MNKLSDVDIASICHDANRAYCLANGDNSVLPWRYMSEPTRRITIQGVCFALCNPDATAQSMHANWSKDKTAAGWVYGKDKDEQAKTHPCLVPYEELPAFQRKKDELFLAIVRVLEDNHE